MPAVLTGWRTISNQIPFRIEMSGRAFKQILNRNQIFFLYLTSIFKNKSSKLTIDFQVIFDGVKNQCNKNRGTITICLHLKIWKTAFSFLWLQLFVLLENESNFGELDIKKSKSKTSNLNGLQCSTKQCTSLSSSLCVKNRNPIKVSVQRMTL